MAVEGYIKLWRKMQDHEIMRDDWLCRLWLWCLFQARYRPDSSELKRGQFVTGKRTGAVALGVSPSKFYRGINKLEALRCIDVKSDHDRTMITVCNYTTYQDAPEGSEPQADHERTTSGPRADHPPLDRKKEEGRKKAHARPAVEPGESPTSPEFDPSSLPLPPVLESPAFRRSWAEWLAYRRDRRLTARPQTLAKQLELLASFGESGAIASINQTIRNGWQGLFEPEKARNGTHKPRAALFSGPAAFAAMGDE